MKNLMMIAVAALCTAAFAEGPRQGGMPRAGMQPGGMSDPLVNMVMNPRAAEKLGLSDEQKAKLKEVMDECGDKRETQKKVREATMKQFELMKAEKVDEAAIMSAIDEVFELRKQMAKDQVKRLIAVKSILTPEQIAKAHEEMKAKFQRRGNRQGGRQGGSRGAPKAGPEAGPEEGPAPDGAPAPAAE